MKQAGPKCCFLMHATSANIKESHISVRMDHWSFLPAHGWACKIAKVLYTTGENPPFSLLQLFTESAFLFTIHSLDG